MRFKYKFPKPWVSYFFKIVLQALNLDQGSRILNVDDELQSDLVCGNETRRNSEQKKHAVTIDNKLKFVT